MKLSSLSIEGFKKFSSKKIFKFNGAQSINTISGQNGSGKTTIADALLLVQQGFFGEQLNNKYPDNSFTHRANEAIENNIFNSMCLNEASITAEFSSGTNIINVELEATLSRQGTITWKLNISEPDRIILLDFWNLDDPNNIIVYIESNKHYNESDTPFSELTVITKYELPVNRETWITLNMVFFPGQTFHLLYKNLLMDWAYERLIPTKGKQDLYSKLGNFLFSFMFPHITFKHFSGNNFRPDEIVSLVSNNNTGGKKYDMRQLSSGEKAVYYLFLYLNLVAKISILLIDEPENHMHEDLISRFTLLLEKLSQESLTFNDVLKFLNIPDALSKKVDSYLGKAEYNKISQVFMFTHSKSLIYSVFDRGTNFMLDNDLLVLEYESCEKVLRELGFSTTFSKVLFVEGELEIDLLNYLTSNHNIRIEKVGNCEKLIRIYKGLKDVQQYLRDSQFVFLLDLDTRDDIRLQEVIREDNNFILLERHELENYLLDIEIWVKASLNLASDDIKDEITFEYIESLLKVAADQQLENIKKMYICNRIRGTISDYQAGIKHRTIPIESLEMYKTYIDTLFSEDNIRNGKAEFTNAYEMCSNKYNNWEAEWINLCPGKQVFRIAASAIGTKIGVTSDRFIKELTKLSLTEKTSSLSKLLLTISEKFTEI